MTSAAARIAGLAWALVSCGGPAAGVQPDRSPLEQALHLRDQGRFDDAERDLKTLAEAGDGRALIELAETLMLRGRHGKAAELLKERYKLAPDDPDLVGATARALDGAGLADEAATAYVRRLQLVPRDLAAALRLTEILVGRGDLVQACMVAEAGLRAQPDHAGLHSALSRALLGRGRVPQALEHARLATNYAAEDASVWLQLAQVHLLIGELEAAKVALERCLKLDPQNVDALRDMGVVLLELGDAKGAVVQLKRATHIAPDSAAAWTALGVARHRAGDLVGAMAALEHASRLQPHAAQIHANLAEVALDDGYPRRAVTEARKARDRLGSTAGADLRKRIERLHARAVVVALLADALCRGDKDGAALQQAAEHELHDAGLDAWLPEIPKLGAQCTHQVKLARERCTAPGLPPAPTPAEAPSP